MRINFETSGNYINLNGLDSNKSTLQNTSKTVEAGSGAFFSKAEKTKNYGSYGKGGESIEDIMKKADAQNLEASFDYMTLMSNTTSGRDYAKMWEDGFDISEYSPEEAVTIMDRIKSALIEGGAYIPGYTDSISDETLKNIAGDEGVFLAMKSSFSEQEVNLTEKTAKDVIALLNESEELTKLDTSAIMYLVDNSIEPTIHNLYLATHSVASGRINSDGTALLSDADVKELMNTLQDEISKVQADSGIIDSKEALDIAKELLKYGLPLNSKTMSGVKELTNLDLPISKSEVIKLAAVAVAEGKEVNEANPFVSQTNWNKAEEIYFDIKEKRILEETRLIMTIDANKKLLESNVAIDTSNLEDLVDKLKLAEEKIAKSVFADRPEEALELLHQYDSANDTFLKIKSMPLDTIPEISDGIENLTPAEIKEAGESTALKLSQANEQYETYMTKPRYDLGDRISTAFQNAKDILEEMGMEATQDNLRAVRALGYNSMEINAENIEKIRLADIRLRNIVSEMKPGVVLGMIRDKINPLETSMEEIEKYLRDKDSSAEANQKKYSEYLYALEKNKEISEEEKESYIGIFRLIRQVEKSDGAILGSLINQGAEISFDNLLHAYRSKKNSSRDIKIGDDAKYSIRTNEENTIDSQINSAYMKQKLKEVELVMDEKIAELEKEAVQAGEDSYGKYLKEVYINEVESIPLSEKELEGVLKELELSPSIGNIQAISDFWKNSSRLYERIREINTRNNQEELEDEARQLITDELDEIPAVRYENFINSVKEKINSTLNTKSDISTEDTRLAGLIYKQLGFCLAQVKENSYHIPIKIGDEINNVHLTLKSGSNEKGIIDISMDTQMVGKISLNLVVKSGKISASVVYEREESTDIINDFNSKLEEAIKDKGYICQGLYSTLNKNYQRNPLDAGSNEIKDTSSKELFGIATTILGKIGEIPYENKL